MYSKTFFYEDTSSDITEHDLDIVSELWTMDGRDVYRGSRDPRYTHADVYSLYDENLQRVGLVEHDKEDHAKCEMLWFYDSEFATLFQEPDWKIGSDIWSVLPKHVFERFLNEGWTTPMTFLEHCLHGPVRVLTPSMLRNLPIVYSCPECKKRSLRPCCNLCVQSTLDIPDLSKVFFIDDDMVVHIPPENSRVWSNLRPRDDGSSLPEQAQVERLESPQQSEHLPPPAPVAQAGSPEPRTVTGAPPR